MMRISKYVYGSVAGPRLKVLPLALSSVQVDVSVFKLNTHYSLLLKYLKNVQTSTASELRVTWNVVATPEPDDVNHGRPRPPNANNTERRRRLPEHIQMRLEMRRGRRIDLNLTRSRKVNFKVGRGRDEDDVPSGHKVFIGERGRVTAWSPSDNEVNIFSTACIHRVGEKIRNRVSRFHNSVKHWPIFKIKLAEYV